MFTAGSGKTVLMYVIHVFDFDRIADAVDD